MQLMRQDWAALEREISRRSIAEYLKLAWRVIEPGMAYVHGWHMDAMAEHLYAVYLGQINRLLINIPPGTSKSTAVSVVFPSWLWGPGGRPSNRIIGASHEQGLAVRDNRKTRNLVSSEWFQELWPLALLGDQNEKIYFENEETGFRQACAVTSMTGRRGDVIVWDDPHSVEDAHSEAKLEATTRVFKETLPTRLNSPEHSCIIVVKQRLNVKDVSGVILAEDIGYEHLCLPMEFDINRKCRTSIGWQDPRTTEGELLFEGRFPRHVVDRDKKVMGAHAVAGQFQQSPTIAGGNLFKQEWWKYWTALPRIDWRAIYADTASKDKEQNDYTVLQCWGKTVNGQACLIDQLRGKWKAPELLVNTRAFWLKHLAQPHLGPLRSLKIEDKSSGTSLIQTLQSVSVLNPIAIPVIAVQRSRDKVSRAHDVLPQIEAGNVFLPQQASFLSDLIGEASAFPNGEHDDQLDPLIDAIVDMLGTGPTAQFFSM